jgi:polysaccharide biosynthesis transport protein
MSERLTSTYADLAHKAPTLQATIKQLNLPYDEAKLDKIISIKVVRNTQLLEIAVENESPELARDIANTLADVFITQRAADQSGQTAATRQILDGQITGVEADMKATTQDLERARAGGTPTAQSDVSRLQGLLAQQQATYSQLIKSQADIALAEARSTNSLKVVVPAEAIQTPVRPNVLQNTALAAVVGLLLALGAIFLVEYLDDTVKSEGDIQQATGLATLAVVPKGHSRKDKNGQPRPLRPSDHKGSSTFGEAYRLLRVNVDFAWAGAPGKTILFTSARPGEGKTTTVANLALSLAQDNRRVVVVDADLRRPSSHRAFDLVNDRGLSNALADPRLRATSLLQPTGVAGLNILTAGPIPPNPAELLGSPRFAQVLAGLAPLADVILVDAPPVLGLVDPAIISTKVDGVILVTEAGLTRVEALGRAVETIERAGARRLGVVLNKASDRSSSYGYYYYRSGYYRRDGEAESSGTNGLANGQMA